MKVLTSYVVYSKFHVDRKMKRCVKRDCSQVTNTSAGGVIIQIIKFWIYPIYYFMTMFTTFIKRTTYRLWCAFNKQHPCRFPCFRICRDIFPSKGKFWYRNTVRSTYNECDKFSNQLQSPFIFLFGSLNVLNEAKLLESIAWATPLA